MRSCVPALMLFADSFTYIQNVILTKQLRFREIFFRSTVSTVVAGVAAVAAAACGWGLWALILQYLLKSVLYCLITCLRAVAVNVAFAAHCIADGADRLRRTRLSSLRIDLAKRSADAVC